MALVKTNNSERTEILFGQPAVLEKWKQCAFNTKNEINIYADSSGSLETLGFKNYLEILRSLKEKGVRIRYITEISKSNLQFCKMLMNIIPEFHHLDGIKGAFGVTDDEFLATATLQEVKPISHAIYSSAKQLVEVQRHIFETLWDRSVLAERKLKEIEEGTEPEFFEVINDPQRSTEIITNLAGMIHNEALVLLPLSKSMVRLYKLGILKHLANSSKRSKIRIICPIDSENEGIVQDLRSQSNISILNGPLDMTKIQNKTLVINKDRFDLSEVISLMVEDFRNQIKSNQAYVSIELLFTRHDPVFVEADKDKIAQIISNLIHNALKFTEKGTILVSLKKGQNEVTISVKDTGAGIESHIIPNLFTKFTTKHHSGTGVGLYISKNIVEAHGGRIWGKNNSHGKGATFAFTLPAKS